MPKFNKQINIKATLHRTCEGCYRIKKMLGMWNTNVRLWLFIIYFLLTNKKHIYKSIFFKMEITIHINLELQLWLCSQPIVYNFFISSHGRSSNEN